MTEGMTGPEMTVVRVAVQSQAVTGYFVSKETLVDVINETAGVVSGTKHTVLAAIERDWKDQDKVDSASLSVRMGELSDSIEDLTGFRALLARMTNLDLVPIVFSPTDADRNS